MLPSFKAPKLNIVSPETIKYASLRRVGLKPKASPRVVQDLVTQSARAEGLDPKLLHALIRVESSGNQLAVSGVGAAGLTQLMNDTGREWHQKLGIQKKYDPFDVTQSVRIGAAYLRFLIDHYNGDVALALTAYNQGYGRVNKLMKANSAKSLKGIINHLGPDGRAYARNVLAAVERMRG